MLRPFLPLTLVVVCVASVGAQPTFECQSPTPFLLSATPDCELNVSTVNGSPNGDAYVDTTPYCGFPTEGNQYLIIPGNNPNNVVAPPFGGPVARPLPAGYSEVQVVIPPSAVDVSIDWNFFNQEGLPVAVFNDGMSIDVVDPATGLSLLNIAYADTNTPLAPSGCTGNWMSPNGGGGSPSPDTGADGPETTCVALPAVLPPNAYLSIAAWSGGDDMFSSAGFADNIVFDSGCFGEWQINTPDAALDVDGLVLTNPLAAIPAISNVTAASTISVNLGSQLIGNVQELAITFSPLVGASAGGFTTANGQTVNFGLTDPTLLFVFGPLTPFGSATVFSGNYTIPVTMTAPGIVASAQFGMVNPASPDGFSLSQGSEVQVFTCNLQETFDTLPTGPGQASVGWSNPGIAAAMPWTVNTGGTPSTGTGPTAATSAPNYLYTETSGAGIGARFVVDTCPVDFSQLSTNTLDFDLSRIGFTVGTLNIYLDDGSGGFTTLIGTYSGPDPSQAQGGTEWSAESINLAPFIPASNVGAVRFEHMAGPSFTGDLAIDNVFFN